MRSVHRCRMTRLPHPPKPSQRRKLLGLGFLAQSALDKYTSGQLRRPAIKLSVFCGVSVDGFLARPDHALDFLDAGGQEPHGFEEFYGSVVEQMSGQPVEIVRQLRSRGFKHAYIDGGVTIQRFLAAGCIDRLVITRVPVLIGAGIPLFGPVPRDISLRHVATRTYKGGLVQSEYEIDPDGCSR